MQIHLSSRIDGILILSIDGIELFQKVPESTLKVFGIGSTHPGAILYDASDLFDVNSFGLFLLER